MERKSYELTTEALYNQEWKCKVIIGYGAGIYVGEGANAKYIAKANADEIGYDHLMNLYTIICDQHNCILQGGSKFKARKVFFLKRAYNWIRVIMTPDFEYNYPADIDKDHDL